MDDVYNAPNGDLTHPFPLFMRGRSAIPQRKITGELSYPVGNVVVALRKDFFILH
jgi:hypothetical protein